MTTAAGLAEPELPRELEVIFQRGLQDLQMLPAVAMQALEIARDPDCVIAEFTAVVERDVKLAADLLTMANSVMFARGRRLSNLHQAVVRLGFRQCRSLILTASMASLMKKMALHEEWIREILWRHGFLTAMLAVNINRSLGAGFQGEEFAAGLVHDLGRTLLAVCLPEQFPTIDPMDFDESAATLLHERQHSGTHHSELGAWFAWRQQLPGELVDVIRFHHEPEQSEQHRRLVSLIGVSDHMANYIQRTGSADDYDVRENSAVDVLEASGIRQAGARLLEKTAEIMRSAEQEAQELMIS